MPAETRVQAYDALVERYPQERVVVSAFPAAMRYARSARGDLARDLPQELRLLALHRGPRPRGCGDYYVTYDAQLIFDEFEPRELEVEPMFFEHAFYCRVRPDGDAEDVPHTGDDHVFLSGTKVRELLSQGELPPEEFSRPEVAEILIEAYRSP